MVKIRSVFVIVGILFASVVTAEDYLYGYLVEFTDKANSVYSIDSPGAYLSQRAIDRRIKYGIEITEQDLPVNQSYIETISSNTAKLHVTSRWFNSAVFYTNMSNFVNETSNLSFVKNVTLVYSGGAKLKSSTNNKWVNSTDDALYGQSFNQIAMCNAHILHNNGFKGDGLQIAVLDAGFWRVNEMACFDSLFQNNRILGNWDFVSDNENVFDDHTHGMAVLSTMGGNLPGQLVGTAPMASYYLYRTENSYSEYPIEEENWIMAAEMADSAGVDIITASLGYSTYDDVNMSHTYADMDGKSTRITLGAEIAFSKGIFLVNSAGNEGNNEWRYLTAPSDGENVLCVGAVDENENIAAFSGFGPSYDGRVKPDVVAKGLATTLILADETVGTGNGTSFSCPVMAGMVACLWQALPEYSNKELLDLIRSSSDRYNSPDSRYGFGIPDFRKATFIIDSSNFGDNSDDKLVKVYPNPFYDELNFHLFIKKGQEVEIILYDARGVKIYSQIKQVNSASYNLISINNLVELEDGYYFLSVLTAYGLLTEKITKF